MVAQWGPDIVNLAKDILDAGLSPIDLPLVMPKGSQFVVLEGNRRVAAVKLLHAPALAQDDEIQAQIEKLITTIGIKRRPDTVDCAVVPDRASARHWILLRHTGPNDGIGVVRWNALMRARFDRRPGPTTRALSLVEGVQHAYPRNEKLQKDLEELSTKRLTNLARLIADPYVRRKLGFEIQGDRVLSYYTSDTLLSHLERIIHDLSRGSVDEIMTKEQRAQYIDSFAELPQKKDHAAPMPLDTAKQQTAKRPPRKTKPAAVPTKIFREFDPTKMGVKVQRLVGEIRLLNVEKYPHACALLVRSVIEIAVTQVHVKHGWPTEKRHLADLVRKVLVEVVDPSQKERTYQAVRTGLNNPNSLISITTLHALVHNQAFSAAPGDVRVIASNFEPFLIAVNKSL